MEGNPFECRRVISGLSGHLDLFVFPQLSLSQKASAPSREFLHGCPVVFIRSSGRHSRENGMLREKGSRRDHDKSLFLQQIPHLHQRVVIMPVSVHCRDDRRRVISLQCRDTLCADMRNKAAVNRHGKQQRLAGGNLDFFLNGRGRQPVVFFYFHSHFGSNAVRAGFGRAFSAEIYVM